MEERNIEEEFQIDSPEKAEWAIKKIKEAQKRRDIFLQICESEEKELLGKKEKAQQDYENETSYLLQKLNAYMDELPCKKTKTQMSFDFPSGKAVRKLEKIDYEKDEKSLLAWLEINGKDFVEYVPKIKWAELKKQLVIVGDGVVVRQDTGEQVEGVTTVTKPSKFDIK